MEGVLLLFLIVTSLSGALSQCNRNSGPSGVTECINITRYNNQYQWGTCITDAYMRAKSNREHRCIDRTRTYCYYQCMLESFNKEEGYVNSSCSCKPGDAYTEKNLTLPSECYSPSGTSCDWYLECLHKKYPCSETGDDYALTYATKFCNLYEKHYSGFSQDGQKWVDSVRKCLQVKLVPYIRPYSHLSCAEVKKVVFDSHVPCYVKPDEQDENVTICNLGLDDFFKILLTIKSSYFISDESSIESLAGIFTTMKKCASIIDLDFSNNDDMRVVKLKVAYDSNSSRKRRSADDISGLKRANDIGNHIANQLDWLKQGVTWFTFAENGTNSELEFNILLADRSRYDLDTDNYQRADLNRTVDNLQDQVVNGEITSSQPNSGFYALSVSSCSDVDCNNVTAFYTAPPTTTYIAPPTTTYIAPPTTPYVAPPATPHIAPPTTPYVAPPTTTYVAPPTTPYVAPPTTPYVAPPTTPYVAPPTTPYVAPPTTTYGEPLNSKEATFCIRQILGQLILCFLIAGNFIGF